MISVQIYFIHGCYVCFNLSVYTCIPIPHLLLIQLRWGKNTTEIQTNFKAEWTPWWQNTIGSKLATNVSDSNFWHSTSNKIAPMSPIIWQYKKNLKEFMVRVQTNEWVKIPWFTQNSAIDPSFFAPELLLASQLLISQKINWASCTSKVQIVWLVKITKQMNQGHL